LAEILPQNHQNVKKSQFWLKVPVVNGLSNDNHAEDNTVDSSAGRALYCHHRSHGMVQILLKLEFSQALILQLPN